MEDTASTSMSASYASTKRFDVFLMCFCILTENSWDRTSVGDVYKALVTDLRLQPVGQVLFRPLQPSN